MSKKLESTIVAVIRKTNEHHSFKLMDKGDNRKEISLVEVEKKKESMRQHGYIYSCPIIVDESYLIQDGQHRFLAAKDLGIPFSFIVCDQKTTPERAMLRHDAKKWRPIDVIYAYRKKPAYEFLINYSNIYGLDISKVYTIVTGKILVKTDKELYDGSLTITAEMIQRFHRIFPKLKDLVRARGGEFKSQLLAVKVLKVLCVLLELPEYNHKQMLKNLKSAPMDALFTFNKPSDAARALQKIHNGKGSKNSKVNLLGDFL